MPEATKAAKAGHGRTFRFRERMVAIMDDLASKLNDLLGSSDGMDKIRNLASMLGASGKSPEPQQEARQPEPHQAEPRQADSRQESPLAGLSALIPEGDGDLMRMMMKMAPLLAHFRQEDDSTRLLRCLRPFLSEPKQKKLDEAVKLLQFMRVIPFLKDSGLF